MIAKRANSKIFLFSAAALFAGATALAQIPPPGGTVQQMPPGQQQQNQQPGMPTDPNVGVPGMSSSTAPPMADQQFVRSVFESDAAEVELGQLAQTKSQSDDVKQFGEKMVENRKRLDDQLQPIAKELEVNAPKGPSKKDKELIARLSALSGPQFDQEYIKAVVKDHQKDVKAFKSEALSAQVPNVQRAAKLDMPVIQEHLDAIEQIAQNHNVPIEEKKK